MKTLAINILLSGAGASLALIALKNLVPKDKIGALFYRLGRAASALGRMRLGKAFYEPMEDYFENLLKLAVEKFDEGLDSDDQDETTKDSGK
jgi:hypothetical protein